MDPAAAPPPGEDASPAIEALSLDALPPLSTTITHRRSSAVAPPPTASAHPPPSSADDSERTVFAPSGSSGRLSTRRTIAHLKAADEPRARKSTWIARKTVTYGNDEAQSTERFYEDVETGATQWERPVDYQSEEEAELEDDRSRMNFDHRAPLQTSYLEIDILGNDATQERNLFIAGGTSVHKSVENRLEQLSLLMRHVGEPEEWDEIITQYDFQMPRILFSYWSGEKTTSKVRLLVGQLFVIVSHLRPEIWAFMVGKQWSTDPRTFSRTVERGVTEALMRREPLEKAMALDIWMTVCRGVYQARHTLGVPPTALILSESFCEDLFGIMATQPEEVFLNASKALMALNWHLTGGLASELEGVADEEIDLSELKRMQIQQEAKGAKPLNAVDGWVYGAGWNNDDAKPRPTPESEVVKGHVKDPTNVVVRIAGKRKDYAQLFSEALIHLLNEQHYPYKDGILLAQMLRLLRTLLENDRAMASASASGDSVSEDMTGMFLSNDLKIIIDICVLELGDLPVDDMNRLGYMQALLGVITRSDWARLGFYKRKEIIAVLYEVITSAAVQTPKPFRALAQALIHEAQR